MDWDKFPYEERHWLSGLIFYGTGIYCDISGESNMHLLGGPRFPGIRYKITLNPEYPAETNGFDFFYRYHDIHNEQHYVSPLQAALSFVNSYRAWLAAGEPLERVEWGGRVLEARAGGEVE